MEQIAHLLKLSDCFCGATGIAEATLSNRLFMDGKRIAGIRSGSDVGARRLERAILWFSANWPEGAEWPDGIQRPIAMREAAE